MPVLLIQRTDRRYNEVSVHGPKKTGDKSTEMNWPLTQPSETHPHIHCEVFTMTPFSSGCYILQMKPYFMEKSNIHK